MGKTKSAKTKIVKKTAKATPKAKAKLKAKTKASPVKSKAQPTKKISTAPKTKAATPKPTIQKVSGKAPTAKFDQMKLKPLQNRILVELVTAEKTTPGGLIIPETAQVSGNFKGTVLAVGSGIFSKKGKHRPMEVKPGDKVLFAEWSGDKIEMNGKTLHILRESDVLGLVD